MALDTPYLNNLITPYKPEVNVRSVNYSVFWKKVKYKLETYGYRTVFVAP